MPVPYHENVIRQTYPPLLVSIIETRGDTDMTPTELAAFRAGMDAWNTKGLDAVNPYREGTKESRKWIRGLNHAEDSALFQAGCK